MLISFFALLLLCLVSHDTVNRSAPLLRTRPTLLIASGMLVAFGIAALVTGWWSVARGPDLLTRGDNARRALSDRYVTRGALLDRNEQLLSQTIGTSGEYMRHYLHPRLGNILGYSTAQFGQSGLENGLDAILRGEEFQPALTLWLDHILYGQPSPGLDIKLSLDLNLELSATQLLQDQRGAAVLLDASSGEILAMTSQPGFDGAKLEADWDSLIVSADSPLLNRAAQGAYPPGAALGPFLLATANSEDVLPAIPAHLTYDLNGETLQCSSFAEDPTVWDDLIVAGCPGPLAELGLALGEQRLLTLFTDLGFYQAPAVPLEIHTQSLPANLSTPGEAATGQGGLLVSPLQMALAAAALSNGGAVPPAQLVLAIENAEGGWRDQVSDSAPVQALTDVGALSQAQKLANDQLGIWELSVRVTDAEGENFTWYLAGSLPGTSTPRVVAVLLESNNAVKATSIGRTLLLDALN
jgi:peptidoglycan glycosyltransferase